MRDITKYIDSLKTTIEYRVGKSAKENFDLIDDSNSDDLWFHISQESSCHVVATIPPGSNYDKKTLQKIAVQGAVICKQHSRYKSEKDVNVMWTPVRNIVKGSTIGCVYVDVYKIIIL